MENNKSGIICRNLGEPDDKMLKKMVDFKVRKEGGFLADYLAYKTSTGNICSPALDEERSNKARTYLIEDSETGELIAYFTLKAGLVGFKKNRNILDKAFDAMSGIEVANLAVNEVYKQAHKKLHGIGYMVFRNYILPKAEEAQQIIGAEILYIYALPRADLINRYKGYGFTRLVPFQQKYLERRFRPGYDEGCVFMYQIL